MKQFFQMMFASALGGLLALAAILLAGASALIVLVATLGHQPDYKPDNNTVLKIALKGELQETVEENPLRFLSFGESLTPLSLRDVRRAIRAAKEHPQVRGIYLEAGSLIAGTAAIDAVRRDLTDFRENGKFVVAYADSYTQAAYYLCSVADKVFLNPLGMLDLHGMVNQTTFYKGVLAKVGLEMLVFRAGTHKGAVESYLLDKLSEENRRQIASFQQIIWGNITRNIAQSRGLAPQEVNRFADRGDFLSGAEKTVEVGLVDELKYRDEAETYVRLWAGQTGEALQTAGVNRMKTVREIPSANTHHPEEIAIVYAEGEIMNRTTASLYDGKCITEELGETLAELRKDDRVKAVVLRINSPGGSAFVAEQLWKEADALKKVKPLVVSMGNVAASGGYYIACAAHRIVAEAHSLTGSIGVFSLLPNAAELYKKLDITTQTVQTNTYGDLLSLAREPRTDEKALVQAHVEHLYEVFLQRCADGRGKTPQDVNRIAQGRLWTGGEAVEIGLADATGGMDQAVDEAAALAQLPHYRLRHVTPAEDFLQSILELSREKILAALSEPLRGETFRYLKALGLAEQIKGVPQARLPYNIQPL
ncbi:MAG: signal peptide peptidase SppA [Tannerellaceae bacterium]|jgi:protease-4|nr:signal peptide peptidase SppA [Tannerellaceae bacterium]